MTTENDVAEVIELAQSIRDQINELDSRLPHDVRDALHYGKSFTLDLHGGPDDSTSQVKSPRAPYSLRNLLSDLNPDGWAMPREDAFVVMLDSLCEWLDPATNIAPIEHELRSLTEDELDELHANVRDETGIELPYHREESTGAPVDNFAAIARAIASAEELEYEPGMGWVRQWLDDNY